MTKLNLGCGKKLKEGYINIDIQKPCDLVHDLRNPLPFNTGSVDEIFTEGSVISLFSYKKEWPRLKQELSRVLKSGGKLEIECVDFEYVLKAFLNNTDGQQWTWWRQTIFAGQDNEYDFAKNGFTYEKLVADLSEVGMINFTRQTEDISEVDIHLICFKV